MAYWFGKARIQTFPGEQTPVAPLASGNVHRAPSGLSTLGHILLDPFLDRLYYQVWETEDPIAQSHEKISNSAVILINNVKPVIQN